MRPHLQYLNKYLNNGNISEVKKHKNSLCNMRTNISNMSEVVVKKKCVTLYPNMTLTYL